ncbi:hypothetical protein DRI50_09070, partial [candidate division KSB1 bacterium]
WNEAGIYISDRSGNYIQNPTRYRGWFISKSQIKPQETVEKGENTFISHPREGGGPCRQAHLVLQWMPARL